MSGKNVEFLLGNSSDMPKGRGSAAVNGSEVGNAMVPWLDGGSRTALVACWMVLGLCCMLANALVICTIIRTKRLHNVAHALILSMAVDEHLILWGRIVLTFPTVFIKDWIPYERNSMYFILVGVLVTYLFRVHILNLALVAANRFCAVVLCTRYCALFSGRRTLCLLAAVWVCSFAFTVPQITGKVKVIFLPTYCAFMMHDSNPNWVNASNIMITSLGALCSAAMAVLYAWILVHLRSSRVASRRRSVDSTGALRRAHWPSNDEMRLLIQFLCITVAWLITFCTLMIWYNLHVQLMIELAILMEGYCLVNLCINQFLYLKFNTPLRESALKMVTCGRWNRGEEQ